MFHYVGPRCHVKLDCTSGKLYSRTSFVYKCEASTLTPFVKPWKILNLAVQNGFYIQSYEESAFTCNVGSTFHYNWREELKFIFEYIKMPAAAPRRVTTTRHKIAITRAAIETESAERNDWNTELFCIKGWRLISAQLSSTFRYSTSSTVSVILQFL